MSVKLSRRAYDHAQQLIKEGKAVRDERDAWSEHQPSTRAENEYIQEHGYAAYGLWHLGVDAEKSRDTKARYRFPYGDFEEVHRCGVLSAESRAAQNGYADIQAAAAHLHGMLEVAPQAARG